MSFPLSKLDAGRDLDAQVAIAAFGWRWFLKISENKVALFPPDDTEGLVRWNFHAPLWRQLDNIGGYERFSDWDKQGGPLPEFNNGILGFLPHYSTNQKDCALVKLWLRERQYTVCVTLFPTGYTVVNAAPYKTFESGPNRDGDTEEEALCRLLIAVATSYQEESIGDTR